MSNGQTAATNVPKGQVGTEVQLLIESNASKVEVEKQPNGQYTIRVS